MNDASPTILSSHQEIDAAFQHILEQLTAQLDDRPTTIVGIHDGGAVFASRLHTALAATSTTELSLGTLDIAFYRDDLGQRSQWPSLRGSDIPVALDDKVVVLVDDVVHTGRTIRAAIEALFDYGRPARVLLVALVDRPGRQLPLHPDITGLHCDLAQHQRCKVQFVEQGVDKDQLVEETDIHG